MLNRGVYSIFEPFHRRISKCIVGFLNDEIILNIRQVSRNYRRIFGKIHLQQIFPYVTLVTLTPLN